MSPRTEDFEEATADMLVRRLRAAAAIYRKVRASDEITDLLAAAADEIEYLWDLLAEVDG